MPAEQFSGKGKPTCAETNISAKPEPSHYYIHDSNSRPNAASTAIAPVCRNDNISMLNSARVVVCTIPNKDDSTNTANDVLHNVQTASRSSDLISVEKMIEDHDDDRLSVVIEDSIDPVMGDSLFNHELEAPSNPLVHQLDSKVFSVLAHLIKCPFCYADITSVDNLLDHVTIFHFEGGICACSAFNCSAIFSAARDLIAHTVNVHPDSLTLSCQICGMILENVERAEIHLDSHGTDCWVCQGTHGDADEHVNCNHRPIPVSVLSLHHKAHFNMYRYRCKFCDKQFDTMFGEKSLISHLKADHEKVSCLGRPVGLSYRSASVA